MERSLNEVQELSTSNQMFSKKIQELTARPVYIPKTLSTPNLNIKLSKLDPLPLLQSFDMKHKGKHIKISPDGKVATGERMYGGYSVISPKPLTSFKPNENWFRVAILHTGIRVGVALEDLDP